MNTDTFIIPRIDTPIFDLTAFLEVGVEYDHLTLKRLSWEVGDLGLNAVEGDPTFRIGKRFYDAIYEWWQAGYIELTKSALDGEPCDFWTAVFMSKHPESRGFKTVEGYLKILARPEELDEEWAW